MTPRETEIRQKNESAASQGFYLFPYDSDISYLLAQLTTAREIIEVAKGALTDIVSDPGFEIENNEAAIALLMNLYAHKALAKITEMEKEK